jgi:hypothetical protein
MITFFAGLWPLLWHFVGGSVTILACLAIAWFVPPFRQLALTAALAIGVALGAYTIGVSNESSRCAIQTDKIVVAWQKERTEAEEAAAKSRADAEREVPAVVQPSVPATKPGAKRMHHNGSSDPNDRAR